MDRNLPMTNERSREELLERCRRGSREAFGALFAETHGRVYSVALNFFGGDRQTAEDVTQQVFLKVFRDLSKFRGDAELTTWLYRITVNACIDEQKRNSRLSFFADLFGLGEPNAARRSQEEKLRRRETADEVRAAVAGLKTKFRLPIVLRYVEGLTYREMAEVLECSEGTIASRLNRGHKMLARKLGHLKNEV